MASFQVFVKAKMDNLQCTSKQMNIGPYDWSNGVQSRETKYQKGLSIYPYLQANPYV